MTISYREGVSIGELVVYTPALIIAAFLSVRHGFGRSAGWLFLIIFALARLIGAAMQLATISDPTNESLYIGYAILQNIGLSPLMLATLGLLSRLLDNINRTHRTFINTRILKFIELIIMVALILGIVGGVNASGSLTSTGKYTPGSLSKAGTALFIVCYVAIVICTILISFSISHASHGEKRIFFAVALALPFLLVRLVYSIMSSLVNNQHFNLLTGSVTIVLCMAFIEELIIVILFEGVGLTLSQVPNDTVVEGAPVAQDANGIDYVPGATNSQPKTTGQKIMKVLRYTMIGSIITLFLPSDKNNDVEMQKPNGRRHAGRR
jgi:hypothetical protein